MSNYPRRIKRLEKHHCKKQRQGNATVANRVIFYLPDNHRDDVPDVEACVASMAQVILYDPNVGTPAGV